jgi:hypothetical protein
MHCDALLLVLCGHGRERDGALYMSDGRVLGMGEVAEQLRRARFTGHVLCVLNVCHAGPLPARCTGLSRRRSAGTSLGSHHSLMLHLCLPIMLHLECCPEQSSEVLARMSVYGS